MRHFNWAEVIVTIYGEELKIDWGALELEERLELERLLAKATRNG